MRKSLTPTPPPHCWIVSGAGMSLKEDRKTTQTHLTGGNQSRTLLFTGSSGSNATTGPV